MATASQLEVPGLNIFRASQHPNKKFSGGTTTIRIRVPVLNVIFQDTMGASATPAQHAATLGNTLQQVTDYYLENSYGRCTFEFSLRTAIFDQPGSFRGNAPPRDSYNSRGRLRNAGDYPDSADYTGFAGFTVPSTTAADSSLHRNYALASHRNIVQAALEQLEAVPGTAEDWLTFGFPPGDSGAYLAWTSLSVSRGGERPFGHKKPNGDLVRVPIQLGNRTLRKYVWVGGGLQRQFATFAHELGHTLGPSDFYGTGKPPGTGDRRGYLGSASMMGKGDDQHWDGFNKFRMNWLDPMLLRNGAGRRLFPAFPPVYESRKSAILVYPDPSDHPKELFIFEIRNGDYRFPSGRRVLFDRSLHRNFAGGLLAYHVNSDNSPSAPLVDMEGESPKSAPGQEPGKIRAIPGRLALTDTNLYDHSGTGMRVHVGPVGANGARDIRLWWARVGDSGNQGARFSGDQTELASARLDQDHLVTVAVDGASHGVRVWRPEDDGSVRRADFRNKRVSPAPANRGVAIAAGEFGGGRRFFITVQNQSNRVLHHAWSIRRGRQPAIDPLGKFRSSLPGGRSPKVVHITRSLFVSAGLNANGDVTLQSWRWSPDLVQDQSQPPTLSELVVASFDEFDLSTLAWVRRRGRRRVLLFVGRRRTNGKLRIFTFRVNTSTGRLTRGARLDAGEASDVHVRSLSTSRAVVSCCLPNNRVRLIILDVEDDGATVTRVADTKGHEHLKTTRHHSLTTSSSRVIVGSRNRQDDRLRVALWRVLNDGAVEWVTDSGNLAAEVGAVDISAQFGRRHRAITHVTTAGGRQKLIAWDVNNLPPDVF